MFTPLFRLQRQRRWTQLEREVREQYPELLSTIHRFTEEHDSQRLAELLYEILKRTRDTDLQMSLFLDFGQFMTLQLDTQEHLELPGAPEQSLCRICMETLDDCPAPIYHRTCARWIAHPACWTSWTRANAPPQVGCSCPVNPPIETPAPTL